MKITAVIPVHNQAGLLREALASALSQTRAPDEIVVVDDGSDEDIRAAVADFGPAVTLIRHEQQGPAGARNRAARAAKGDWLAFLDADDLWLPGKLEAQERFAAAHPEVGLVHTDGFLLAGLSVPEPLPGPSYLAEGNPAQGDRPLAALLLMPLLTPSVMVRKEAFFRAGGFDESFRVNEDADLFVRLAAAGENFGCLRAPLVIIRSLEAGRARDRLRYLDESIRLLEKALRLYPGAAPELKVSLWRTLRISARYALMEKQKDRALAYWLQAGRYRRLRLRDLWIAALLRAGGDWGEQRVLRAWQDLIGRLQ